MIENPIIEANKHEILHGSYASEFSAGMPDKINNLLTDTDTRFWGLRCWVLQNSL